MGPRPLKHKIELSLGDMIRMGDQYGLPDLRQFMARASHFPAVPHPTEPFLHHYEAIMVGSSHMGELVVPRGLVDFHGDDSATATPAAAAANTLSAAAAASAAPVGGGVGGLAEMECCGVGGDGGNSRWPRQETLTLLEIRSRLDPKFKEANQKGPLWSEVSRIMAEEHGYQRSGKKCREKFENLYKYYKKTKEGKAGRQDGKHYRFFRQLEALYGETSNNQVSLSETHLAGICPLLYQTTNNTAISQGNQGGLMQDHKFCESHSFSNSSEFDTSSSENNDNGQIYRRVRKSLKGKIKEFVGIHMKKIMDTQEAWMEKMLATIEHKEQESLSREEEWRKQEAARFDREYKFWASERAWVEARDAALMEALKKFTAKELKLSKNQNESMEEDTALYSPWPEPELSSLIHLRTSMESRFQEGGLSEEEEGLWEEIANKMSCLGYDQRSTTRYKQKWENISIYLNNAMEHSKKREENLRTYPYFKPLDSSLYRGEEILMTKQGAENMGVVFQKIKNSEDHGSCLNILLDEEHLWEDYGVKLSMGKNQQVWHK